MKAPNNQAKAELWFVPGSQHLYGDEVLRQVARNAETIVAGLSRECGLSVRLVCKPVMTGAEAIAELCRAANAGEQCIGLVCWMHTFSPAKMWIAGLSGLRKPLAHLHTQLEREIPWSSIDMDYMNLHQSAHGDREFGHICARLGIGRKVIVGHWRDARVQRELDDWARAALAWSDMQTGRIARFGDNMRDVAVTEGDKVAAQARFGFSVNGYGMGDLVACIETASQQQVDALIATYEADYEVAPSLRKGGARRGALLDAARIELGLRSFLESGGFTGFTDTFENLNGLAQLPGIAVQRLMADGYGFGAEGDWKTAALVRAMKIMGAGRAGGVSFMEDYTYHLEPGREMVLGAHMLEVCPTLASHKPTIEIHPLAIGGKADPVRLRFEAAPGPAVNAALVDLGDRFRLLANEVELIAPPKPLEKLPVGAALWRPQPDFPTAAGAWILAGGPHHTCLSLASSTAQLEDFAEIAGVELITIDAGTRLRDIRAALRMSRAASSLSERRR
ncbi:MAG: L-arabinose isomerase [Planctomycetes bacterium]|nr:L-arabinose isomerase [Planctomycetota bacterium]